MNQDFLLNIKHNSFFTYGCLVLPLEGNEATGDHSKIWTIKAWRIDSVILICSSSYSTNHDTCTCIYIDINCASLT